MTTQTTDKKTTSLIKVRVGSEAWTNAIQDKILDSSSLCFVCGDEITFRLNFFYMLGRGVVMFHDDCFSPPVSEQQPRVASSFQRPATWRKLPEGDWLTLKDAAKLIGISYTAMYQRLWSGVGPRDGFMKHYGQWFVSRATVLDMGYGKKSQGRPQGAVRARMWRSDVTESVDRVSASEAAKMIGVSRSWVLSRRGRFDGVKVDHMWFFSKKMIEDFISSGEEYGVV